MKKFLYIFMIVLVMVCLLPFSVQAEENNEQTPEEVVKDSTIIKFDYYPGGTLSKERELTFEWISIEKMENLVIRLFNPKTDVYVDVFDISWQDKKEDEENSEIEDSKTTFNGKFEIIDEPIDDPLTPDIDETKDKFWKYKLTFKIEKETYGLLKFQFIYRCGEFDYENLFYLPNVVYPSVVVPPTPPTSDPNDDNNSSDNDDDSYFTTSNALIAAIFATVCSVIGTLLIIFSSQYRKFDDEEFK